MKKEEMIKEEETKEEIIKEEEAKEEIIKEEVKDTYEEKKENIMMTDELRSKLAVEEGFLNSIIEFRNVGLDYDGEVILDNVSINIRKGEFVYLVGESGAGKSSLIKMIYKEISNTKGSVFVEKENISKLHHKELPRLRRKIGVIFQDYKLLPDKTIRENVAFSLEVTKYPKNKIKQRVEDVLKKVGIASKADKYPDELSGGQQQRAAIARAIVDEPIILVADEPTGNLDPENALSIMALLEEIHKDGTTIVMATHDVGIVNNFAHRVVLLGDKGIVKEDEGKYIYE